MARTSRTDESLREASREVDYELNMMVTTLTWMLQRNVGVDTPDEERRVHNAMIHSFLLATRNLCDFFFRPPNPRDDDILAEDFFDNKQWKRLRPKSVPEFETRSLVGWISKRLLHLTYERAEGTKRDWNPFRVAWELRKLLNVFVAKVKSARLSEELVEDAARLDVILQPYADECESVDDVESAPFSMLWEEKDFWTNPRPVDSDTDEGT